MNAPSPADPLGFDMRYAGGDLDPTGASATGEELAEEAILNRLSCGNLLMIGSPEDQVEFGEDVRLWVAEAVTEASLANKGPRLAIALQRDPRISRADVKVSAATSGDAFANGSRADLRIDLSVVLASGAVIDRVVGISQVTIDFLAQGT